MENKLDEHLSPICPVCSTSVRPGQGAVRPDGYMIHLAPCWDPDKYGYRPESRCSVQNEKSNA